MTTTTTATFTSTDPPPYAKDADLSSLSPPPYPSSSSFNPTTILQISTKGKPWLSFPLPPRPDPIHIYSLSSSGESTGSAPLFTSIRPTRSSGSCYLVSSSSSSSSSSPESQRILSTTTYHFGPSRPAQVRLFLPTSTTTTTTTTRPPTSSSTSELSPDRKDEFDSFPLKPVLSLLSRTVQFQTRLGTFQWRYASRSERRLESSSSSSCTNNNNTRGRSADQVNSLLILERITRVVVVPPPHSHRDATASSASCSNSSTSSSSSKKPEVQVRATLIGKFVRSKQYRTTGSSASSAGNGGRLFLDLNKLVDSSIDSSIDISSGVGVGVGDSSLYDYKSQKEEEEEEEQQEQEQEIKLDKEMMTVLAVTTLLSMLKREIDRRRTQQVMIMVGIAAGGC